jgi:hypothetical protein
MEDIGLKLDVLIKLQAQVLVRDLDGQKTKIIFLHKAGLGPKLIGEILGTSANAVSVALSKARKDKEIE